MHPVIKPVLIFALCNFIGFLFLKLMLFNPRIQVKSTFKQNIGNFTLFEESLKSELPAQQKAKMISQSTQKRQLINQTIKIFQRHSFAGTWNKKDVLLSVQSGVDTPMQQQQITAGKVYIRSLQIQSTNKLNFHLETKYYEQITLAISIYQGQQGQDGSETFEISFDPYDTQTSYEKQKNELKIETIPNLPILINIRNSQYRSLFYPWPLHRAQGIKFDKFKLQFQVPSEQLKVQNFQFNFQITQQNPNKSYDSTYSFQLKKNAAQNFFWSEIIFFFLISNLLIVQLYLMLKIVNDPILFHNQLLKISYYAVLPKFILDAAICISMLYAFLLTQNYAIQSLTQFAFTINPFVIFGVGIFGIASYISDFWLLLVLRQHIKGNPDPWNIVYTNPDPKQIRMLIYITIIVLIDAPFFFTYGYYFVLVYSFKPLIQIIHNVFHRKRPKISSSWYKLMFLEIGTLIFARNSFLNPYDMKSFPRQVGTLSFLFLILIIVIQYLIVCSQQRWGPIHCLPKILRPNFNGYSYQYTLNQQKSIQNIAAAEKQQSQVCAICLMDLNEDVSKLFNQNSSVQVPRVKYSVMKAPCSHLYHSFCLLQWMQQKMECPKCRLKLPPVQEIQ